MTARRTLLDGLAGQIAAWVFLTYLTGDLQVSRDGAAPVFAVLGGLVGMVVARRQPRNPEG